jgi:hypothetical protein
MPVYLNIPSYGTPNSGIEPTNIPYVNAQMPNVDNIEEAVDYLLNNKVEVVPGKGLSTNDLTDELVDKINNLSESIKFSTYSEFPAVGEENILYVDKQTNMLYLWDTTNSEYVGIVLNFTGTVFQSTL